MKLPIKKKYFDLIASGNKIKEFRDAHITFVCEETGRTLRREIETVKFYEWYEVDQKLYDEGVLEDDGVICFMLAKKGRHDE